jgi:osmotically-inducible protein OsmY
MTLKRCALVYVLLAGLLGAGCVSVPSTATASDAEIAAAAQARLSEDAITGRHTFGVTVERGVATVNGSLRDAGALAIVRGTEGVTSVVDHTTR